MDWSFDYLPNGECVTQHCQSVVLLMVGPDLALVARRARIFRQIGYEVVVVRTGDHAVQMALKSDCDMVLICHRFQNAEQESIRRRLKNARRLLRTVTLQESDDADPRSLAARIAKYQASSRIGTLLVSCDSVPSAA